MKSFALAACLIAMTATAAEACVSLVARDGGAGFFNGCGGAVVVKFRSPNGAEGVIGPIPPATEQQVGLSPSGLAYWFCDYGGWVSGARRLP